MAAPAGNQFWKLRSKHGRDALFTNPQLMWEAATEYFNWCDAHPWYKIEAIKSGPNPGKLVKIPTARPYSLSGLCRYIGCNEAYIRQFKQGCSEDFTTVISEIEIVIETQQFEGATVGSFNANIIATKQGLAARIQIAQTDKNGNDIQRADYSKLSVDELTTLMALEKKASGQ